VDRFDWHDGERRIHFGRGRAAEAVDLLGGPGYTLLTTARGVAAAPHVVEAAGAVHHVVPGRVDEIAGDLLGIEGERLAALGGGRVVDTAKAIAAARRASGGEAVAMAVPTTLSGAEMTRTHRFARGAPQGTRHVRAAAVVADPALMASQPVRDLAASALNALGHAVEGPCTRRSNPVATLAGDEAARLLTGAFAAEEPEREALSLGALLAGYSIDSAGYGLHHVLSQTLVRMTGVGHGAANAVLLPHTIRALARRFPGRAARVAERVGEDPAGAAARICALTGATTLSELGVDRGALPACAEAAARRDDLDMTPPRADRAEILALYERAY